MIFDIVSGTNKGRAKIISSNELVNFYPEIEIQGKSKHTKALIGCPGYRLAVTTYNEGVCRGLYTTSTGKMFAVILNKFIEIGSSETYTYRGLLNTSIGMCVFCDNGTQILVTDGTNGYIYNPSNYAWGAISDTDFPDSPSHCIFNNGYFIVNEGGTGKFYFSASYDGTTWDALDFATSEFSADQLVGITKTSNDVIWMIGSQTLELWSGIDNADLPWLRIPGSSRNIGCVAPYSIASNGNNVFWVGTGENGYGSIFMSSGYEVYKVSTPAIEYRVKHLIDVEGAVGYIYTDEGHSFYVVSFSSEVTFVYDIVSKEWHIRGSYNGDTGNNLRQFSQGYAFFNGKHYVGSFIDSGIYEMSLDVYGEDKISGDGEYETLPIVRQIVTNEICNENKFVRHKKVEMSIEKAVGLNNYSSPKIMMRFSNDGGEAWSNKI